jgi:hypothetical protein
MLNYIAAIATAVTLSISPMLSHANVTPIATKKVAVATHTDISVNNQVIIVNTPEPVYNLSKSEQSILRSALLSSVKIIRPKQITA